MMWITKPSAMTSSACTPGETPHTPGPLSTKRPGSTLETSVPKNGTIATAPVKMPNVSQ